MASTDSDELRAAKNAAEQLEKWGDLGRPSPKLPPPGESILIEDDQDFLQRLNDIGITSLPDVAILPRNFNSAPSAQAFAFERETNDLRVIGKQAGLTLEPLVEKPAIIHENDVLTIGVVIVIALKVLEAANSSATLIEFFQRLGRFLGGRPGPSGDSIEVVQEVIVTDGTTAKRFTYRGPARELHSVVDALTAKDVGLDE
ncbi:MAG TPA: hypothetical protein VME66_16685 [Candidatus Acidoferrales bacterium]|nr:hypothetical protein [Candidatus Acidoferrales bacterium]